MVFSSWFWSRTKSMTTKNTHQMLAISKAMRIRWCNVGHIAQWSASVASCKATRCRHWASACAVSPRRLPWSTISKRKKNTTKTQLLSSFLMVDQRKKVSISKTQGPSTHVLGETSSPNCNHYATSLEYPTCPRQALWRCSMPQRVGEGSDVHLELKSTSNPPFSKNNLAGVISQPNFWQERWIKKNWKPGTFEIV